MSTAELSGEQLRLRLEAGEAISILDIREASDYSGWHIPGSRNLPVYDALRRDDVSPLLARTALLPRDRPVVTVCHMGVVSRKAASVLSALGYEALSLSGGMRDWGGVWSEAPVAGRLRDGSPFVQVRRLGKGCLSYLVGSRGEAAVVDPCVDVGAYTTIADREGMTITRVLETHVHADHVSRARPLCEASGATLHMPPNERVRFPYEPLGDGGRVSVGDVGIDAVATPGHTGESVCYLVDGRALLTGDTLFLDAVGRPDLEKGDAGAEAGARMLFASLRSLDGERFRGVWVYPAHHGEPIAFDHEPIGAPLDGIRTRLELGAADEDAFVASILASLSSKPPNYERVLAVNEGRAGLGRRSPLDLEAGPNRCAAG